VSEFDLCMSHPLAASFTGWHGGPGDGGHDHGDWYIRFGMDLGAPVGSEVRAAFTGTVSRFTRDPEPSGKVFGSQLFVRGAGDRMGAYYTHIENVPAGIAAGSTITRGQVIGTVAKFSPSHLHMALVEIVGGLPGGEYIGVSSLNAFFKDKSNMNRNVRFFQTRGRQPTPQGSSCADGERTGEVEREYRGLEEEELAVDGATRWLAAMHVSRLQRQIGNQATGAALRSPQLRAVAATLARAPATPRSQTLPVAPPGSGERHRVV
jgi:hypothetical protein